MSVTDIKEDIAKLSPGERADLVRWIICDLDEMSEPEDEVEAAWRLEVRQRIDAMRTGKIEMVPAEESWKDLFSIYGQTS
jgi:putative addiction module component (TIGR02574 family)